MRAKIVDVEGIIAEARADMDLAEAKQVKAAFDSQMCKLVETEKKN